MLTLPTGSTFFENSEIDILEQREREILEMFYGAGRRNLAHCTRQNWKAKVIGA